MARQAWAPSLNAGKGCKRTRKRVSPIATTARASHGCLRGETAGFAGPLCCIYMGGADSTEGRAAPR